MGEGDHDRDVGVGYSNSAYPGGMGGRGRAIGQITLAPGPRQSPRGGGNCLVWGWGMSPSTISYEQRKSTLHQGPH